MLARSAQLPIVLCHPTTRTFLIATTQFAGSVLAHSSIVTSNEAQRLVEEWLEEEAQSARLPYAEKSHAAGYWLLDGRFNVQRLTEKFAQSARPIPIRTEHAGRYTAD